MPQSIDFGKSVDSCTILAEICTIKVGRFEPAISSHSNVSTMDIDNHADTTVLGSKFLQTHDFEILLDVSGWNASAGSVKCPTISGDISYAHPISGQVYILMYHQAIH